MKKLLIATAALAMVAGTAQAQSSVTVYGIADAGLVSANGAAAGRNTGVSSGVLSTSRLGFRGTEDLGGGLAANFNLESTLNMDTGVSGTTTNTDQATNRTTLFDRQAWVGLSDSKIGSIKLGRTTRLDFDTAVSGDAFGASGFGSVTTIIYGATAATRQPNQASDTTKLTTGDINASRYSNSVTLATARMAGFQLSYQQAFGEVTGANSVGRGTAYALDYTAGKAKATYAYSRQNDGTTGAKLTETSIASASYDFGVAKAFVGMSQLERAGKADKTKGTWVGVTAPVNAKIGVMAQYYKLDNIGNTATAGAVAADDADAYALGATYNFSKRTTAYAMYGRVNNDGASAVTLGSSVAPAAGKNQTGYTVGMRHSF